MNEIDSFTVFGVLMNPHRKEYPEEFIQFFERKIGKNMLDPQNEVLVAVDAESGKVAGVGSWHRHGKGGEERKKNAESGVDPVSSQLCLETPVQVSEYNNR